MKRHPKHIATKQYVPLYRKSDIPYVQKFQEKLAKLFPYESSIDTPTLERFFLELDEETFDACLAETLSKQIRYVPNANNNNRYLYSLLRNQIRGKHGDPNVFKRKNKKMEDYD